MNTNDNLIIFIVSCLVLWIVILSFYYLFKYRNQVYLTKSEPYYNTELHDKIKKGAHHNAWNQLAVGRTAVDCYSLDQRDCMKYSNCGVCMKDGVKQCIPGDVHGPFFKEDCENWMYTDYYDRYIFGERVQYVYPPWSKFYPEYEARYPSPQSRAQLIY